MHRPKTRIDGVPDKAPSPRAKSTDVDIAIVGAGIGGLYAAWKLQRAGRDVKVFEAQDRVGGRLLSVEIPGIPMRAEMGAMRYSRNHKRVFRLIEEVLGIPPDKHTFNFQSRYYVRGRYDTSAYHLRPYLQRLGGDAPPSAMSLICFAILKLMRNMTFPEDAPTALSASVMEKILQSPVGDPIEFVRDLANRLTDTDWEHIKRHGLGQERDIYIPLYATGFWNILQAYLGNEGFQLVHDTFGYESGVGNWNTAEAIHFITKVVNIDDFYRLPDGYQSLAIGLKDRLADDCLILDSRLTELARQPDDEQGWTLTFEDRTGQASHTVTARQVILALPRRALEALRIEHSGWRDFVEGDLKATRPQSAFKVFLVYEAAWWTDYGYPDHFKFVTDIPIRQVYYYGPGWLRRLDQQVASGKPSPGWAMLMCYSDAHYVAFWNAVIGSKDRPYFREPHTWSMVDNETKDRLGSVIERYGASPRMITKLQSQLAELHGVSANDIPLPLFGIYKDWGETDSANAGWHFWEPNYRAAEVRQNIQERFNQFGLYLCNEAYSPDQSWVEGALYSVDSILERLGVSIPS